MGDKVPPFKTAGLGGEPLEVAYQSRERDRLLLFYTPSCPYSRQQFPRWLDLVGRTDRGKIEVLGLVADAEDKVKLREYLDEMNSSHPPGVTFTTAVVPREVRDKYKLSETPLTLLVAGDGTVKEVWAGRWDSKVLASVNVALGVTGE